MSKEVKDTRLQAVALASAVMIKQVALNLDCKDCAEVLRDSARRLEEAVDA